MGYSEAIGSGRLTRKMMAFNINGGSSNTLTINESDEAVYGYILQDTQKGEPLEKTAGGWQLADSNSDGVIAIAAQSGAANSHIEIIQAGLAETKDALTEGLAVYLGGASKRLTTEPPTYATGSDYRRVGFAIAKYLINLVTEPRVFIEN